MADLKTRFQRKGAPKRAPRGAQEGPRRGPKLKMTKTLNLLTVQWIWLFLAPPRGPERAPYGLKIASVRRVCLEIYKILVREGSERAPGPKKSSSRGSQERKKVVREPPRGSREKSKTRFHQNWGGGRFPLPPGTPLRGRVSPQQLLSILKNAFP